MKEECFRLTFDDSDEHAIVCREYQLGDISEHVINEAAFILSWPNDIVFYYESGRPEDFLGNALGWPIFSKRVQEVFIGLGIKNVQFLPINIIRKNTKEVLPGYAVLNILDSVVALDWEHARYVEDRKNPEMPVILKLALRYEIIKDLDIFRLKEQPILIFVSGRIKSKLNEIEATGFKLVSVPIY